MKNKVTQLTKGKLKWKCVFIYWPYFARYSDENDGEEEEEEEDEEFGNDESKEKFDFSSTQRPSSAQYQSYWSTIGRTTNSFSANRGPSATISKVATIYYMNIALRWQFLQGRRCRLL